MISLGSFGVNTFLPAFFSRNFGLDAAEAGFAFGLISGIASLVGTLGGGFGAEYMAKRDRRWLLGFPALCSVIGAPLFVLGLTNGSLFAAVPIMLAGSFAFYTAMGPAVATIHGALDSFSRATGSALFLLVMHMIGQGLGPPLVGLVSDTISAWSYGSSDFAARCAGAAAQAPGSACAAASAAGVKYAIAIFAMFFVLGGGFLLLAARSQRPGREGA